MSNVGKFLENTRKPKSLLRSSPAAFFRAWVVAFKLPRSSFGMKAGFRVQGADGVAFTFTASVASLEE